MSRISANILSLMAQRNLAAAGLAMERSLERLSTGYRINRADDDPAGLVASQRLRSEIAALDSAIANATRAANVVATAEAGLDQVGTLLLDIQGLVDQAANSGGMTSAELAANQLLIDQAIDSIDRIASATRFNGRTLLDGSAGFQTTGVNVNDLSTVIVNQAVFDGSQKAVAYNIDATTAEKAEVTMLAADIGSADGLVRIQGNRGYADLAFTAGMTQAQVIDAVNAATDLTGVVAVGDGDDIDFRSAQYGANQLVSFTRLDGATFVLSADQDYGANATVSSIDGSAEGISVEGLRVAVKRTGLDIELFITDDTVVEPAGAFNIEQGGLRFQIAPQIGPTGQLSVGIRSVAAASLGDIVAGYLGSLRSGGANDLAAGNFTAAADIVAAAADQVSALRGRLGAVQHHALETAVSSMGATRACVISADAAIREIDYAAEMANLTRTRILIQAATSALALATTFPQNVLSLLDRLPP